jgi:hypothetical protein
MRKLRRLPWRIPKSHDRQPNPTPARMCLHAEPEACPRAEPERKSWRDEVNTQPVAFAGGRYVYGDEPSVPSTIEIRRKSRHRLVLVGA